MDKFHQTKPARRSGWRKWGYWTFIGANVAGAILAIPLLMATWPLVKIWWDTRSSHAFEQHQKTPALRANSATTAAPENAAKTSAAPGDSLDAALNSLTTNLEVVGNLSEQDLSEIIASQFGKKKRPQANSGQFDSDSAVFHEITRAVATINGQQYYCYEVDLVDQNGNHKIHIDCFEKPDMDYERSMATLSLVNRNPQLKKIYDAFAHVLAEKSSAPEQDRAREPSSEPALRLEEEAPKDP